MSMDGGLDLEQRARADLLREGASAPRRSTGDLEAVLAVAEAIAAADDMDATLRVVADAAARLLRCQAAAVLLLDEYRPDTLRLVAAFGLSERYVAALTGAKRIEVNRSPSGVALTSGRPVVVRDAHTEPLIAPWRELADAEGYRAMVSVPLVVGDTALGVLNLYHWSPAAISHERLRLLVALAGHAAIAIHNARLRQTAERQVDALRTMVVSLRAQTHEFSNRLHAIGGLLALGEVDEARRFTSELQAAFDERTAAITDRIHEPVLAGYLVAQLSAADAAGVDLTVDPGTSLADRPTGMDATTLVTLVGNLLRNAVEAVDGLPERRRRVRFKATQTSRRTRVVVSDRGEGFGPEPDAWFTEGASSKPGNLGVGLALVKTIVDAVQGRIVLARDGRGWTTVTVDLPGAGKRR
jgi:GAF domain-containing protein/anti-sigma regulatory factor (Ser/Thr protein kinase)